MLTSNVGVTLVKFLLWIDMQTIDAFHHQHLSCSSIKNFVARREAIPPAPDVYQSYPSKIINLFPGQI
jgi:hypothetical protein